MTAATLPSVMTADATEEKPLEVRYRLWLQ